MPRCSMIGCDAPAAWQAPDHLAEAAGSPEFMCEWHFAEYKKFVTSPTPGLDPPRGASDFWRPSLTEMCRLADIDIRRKEREVVPVTRLEDTARVQRMTPKQRATLARLRGLIHR